MTDADNHLSFQSRRSLPSSLLSRMCRQQSVPGEKCWTRLALPRSQCRGLSSKCNCICSGGLGCYRNLLHRLGGDEFGLYYEASNPSFSCINDRGESPAALTSDAVQQYCLKPKNNNEVTLAAAVTTCNDTDEDGLRESVHALTIPGAAQSW
jgi:hypothetical protein